MAEIGTTGATGAAGPARRWSDALRVYLEPASLRMFFLGFGAGLPLLLVLGTHDLRGEGGVSVTAAEINRWTQEQARPLPIGTQVLRAQAGGHRVVQCRFSHDATIGSVGEAQLDLRLVSR